MNDTLHHLKLAKFEVMAAWGEYLLAREFGHSLGDNSRDVIESIESMLRQMRTLGPKDKPN